MVSEGPALAWAQAIVPLVGSRFRSSTRTLFFEPLTPAFHGGLRVACIDYWGARRPCFYISPTTPRRSAASSSILVSRHVAFLGRWRHPDIVTLISMGTFYAGYSKPTCFT